MYLKGKCLIADQGGTVARRWRNRNIERCDWSNDFSEEENMALNGFVIKIYARD